MLPSTWNNLGLGVAASFALLGTLTFVEPAVAEDLFGVAKATSGSPIRQLDSFSFSSLIGSRDIAIAVALFSLSREGSRKEMGTVVLSTLCICLPDLYLVWRNRKFPEYVSSS